MKKQNDVEILIGMSVAKDVTVKFVSQSAIATSFAQSVEDHSSKGGGFFIFGGSSAQASSSSGSSSDAANDTDFISVFEFITTFKKMLDDHNEKYNKQLMSE